MNEVDICNLALTHVHANEISALTDVSEEARQCRIYYGHERDMLLAECDWSFASRRLLLEPLTLPTTVTEWRFAYRVPADCAAFREIVNPAGRNAPPVEYQSDADDGDEPLILTDQEAAVGRYTRKGVIAGRFPAWFNDALSWRLAFRLAVSFVRRDEQITIARDGVAIAVPKAMAIDKNRRARRLDPEPLQHQAR